MIFSLYIFIIGRLISSQGPLVEEDIATATCAIIFLINFPMLQTTWQKVMNQMPQNDHLY